MKYMDTLLRIRPVSPMNGLRYFQVFGLLAVLLTIASCTSLQSTTPPTTSGSSQIIATPDPTIIANLTQMPSAEPLTGPAAEALAVIDDAVTACAEYSPERRGQMQQHIFWLYQPNQIPPDMILALGTNPTGRLIYGMAIYTSTEWRLAQRPRPSCLLDIGLQLNELLIANNEEPLTIYEATPAP